MFDDENSDQNNKNSPQDGEDSKGAAGHEASSNKGSQSSGDQTANMKPSASEMFYSAPRRRRKHPASLIADGVVPMRVPRYMAAAHLHPYQQLMLQSQLPLAASGAYRYHPHHHQAAALPFGGDAAESLYPMMVPSLAEAQLGLAESGGDIMDAHTAATDGRPLLSANQQAGKQEAGAVTPAPASSAQAASISQHEEEQELEAMRKQAEQEHLMEAVHRIRLKAALVAARERQVAEANAAALAAHHQMGLPLAPGQLRLVNY